MSSITGNANDKEMLLINLKAKEAVIFGIKDHLDCIDFLETWFELAMGVSISWSTWQKYHSEGRDGTIIKFEILE